MELRKETWEGKCLRRGAAEISTVGYLCRYLHASIRIPADVITATLLFRPPLSLLALDPLPPHPSHPDRRPSRIHFRASSSRALHPNWKKERSSKIDIVALRCRVHEYTNR